MNTDTLMHELDAAIAFQTRWRRIMSVSYTSMSAMAIISSATATVVAALGHATEAAVLAAVATASLGLEKTWMLREKWIHHLVTATQLRSLRLGLVYGDSEEKATAEKMGKIMEGYAGGLPLEPRSAASNNADAESKE